MYNRKRMNSFFTILIIVTFCGSAYILCRDMYVNQKEKAVFESVSKLAETKYDSGNEQNGKRNITALAYENSECIGWIYIDGTKINYPVMHTPDDPQKYADKDFYGNSSVSGVPFMDSECTVDSDNIIIFGNGTENGTMFADIRKYKDKSFCSKHPEIEFETEDGCETYTVFSAAKVSDDDEWYKYINFGSKDEFDGMIEYLNKKSLYDTGIVPEYGQKIITLSVTGNKKSDSFIVAAVRL